MATDSKLLILKCVTNNLAQTGPICIALYNIWQYRLWSFQTGGTKLDRFLPKNQHTQRKLLNFENWVNGEVSKVPKFDQNLTFKVNILFQKSKNNSIFFKKYQFRSTVKLFMRLNNETFFG